MVEAVLVACLPVLLAAAIAFMNKWLKAKLTPNQYNEVMEVARTGVLAAEKWAANFPEFEGDKKLAYVTDVVNDAAKRVGLKNPSPKIVNAFIHSALAELEGVKKGEEPTVPQSEVQELINQYEQYIAGLHQQLTEATSDNVLQFPTPDPEEPVGTT